MILMSLLYLLWSFIGHTSSSEIFLKQCCDEYGFSITVKNYCITKSENLCSAQYDVLDRLFDAEKCLECAGIFI